MKLRKTTRPQFKRFNSYVEKWMREFGLVGFILVTKLECIGAYTVAASCAYDLETRQCVITLSDRKVWDLEKELEAIAYHEVTHLFLANYIFECVKRSKRSVINKELDEKYVIIMENIFSKWMKPSKIS